MYYKRDRLSQLKISQLLVSFFVLSFSGSEDQALLVEESIKHAKEAVMLDIKDGNSWCKSSLPCVVVRSFFLHSSHLSIRTYPYLRPVVFNITTFFLFTTLHWKLDALIV